jgi:hypothetical protein
MLRARVRDVANGGRMRRQLAKGSANGDRQKPANGAKANRGNAAKATLADTVREKVAKANRGCANSR